MDTPENIYVTKSFLPPIEDYETYIRQIYDNGILTNQGPLLQELEKKLQKFLDIDNLQYVSNGTIALQLALKALEIDDGEIITTPFSYVATTSSILWERCTPVFVDIEADEYADAMVPPLLFVPLIENAFKYGNTAEPARPISISVRVEGRHIECRTANDFAPAAADGDKSASGIGLANLRRRLVLLYGSKASLRTSVEGQTYKSSLKIPINESYG